MVASLEGTAEEKLDWMQAHLETLSQTKQTVASGWITKARGQLGQTNSVAQTAAKGDATAQTDQGAVVQQEQSLADIFRQLFELFDLDGSEKKRILVLGELSFEFSAQLIAKERTQGMGVVATTANTEDEVCQGGKRATEREQAGMLGAKGYSLPQEEPNFSLRFSIFGEKLDDTFKGERFDTIIIHAPHTKNAPPGQLTKANKELMDKIIAAAQNHIKPGGQIQVVGGQNLPGFKADSLKTAREISYADYKYSFPVTPRASPSGDMFGGTFAETNPTGRNLDTTGWSVKILESVAPGEPSTPASK